MRRKPVAIGRLADYAADPEGFVARDGAARDPQAAAHGNHAHRNAVSGATDGQRGLKSIFIVVPTAIYVLVSLLVAVLLFLAFVGRSAG